MAEKDTAEIIRPDVAEQSLIRMTDEQRKVVEARQAFFDHATAARVAQQARDSQAVEGRAPARTPVKPSGPSDVPVPEGDPKPNPTLNPKPSIPSIAPQEGLVSRSSGDGRALVEGLAELSKERGYRNWAQLDADALKAVTNPQEREQAIRLVADNARDPGYAEALRTVDPELSALAVSAVDTVKVASETVAPGVSKAPEAAGERLAGEGAPNAPAEAERDRPQGVQPTAPPVSATGDDEQNAIEAVALAPDRDTERKAAPKDAEEGKDRDKEQDATRARGTATRLLDAISRSFGSDRGKERPKPDARENGNEMQAPAVMTKNGYSVPEAVASRYVVRDGDYWRFDEANASESAKHRPAFRDHGARLATPGEDRGTVADMMTVAQAKGWQEVSLKGSEAFKRAAWIEANLAGIKTRGFEPKEQDRAMLEAARRDREALTISAGRRAPEVPAAPAVAPAAPVPPTASGAPAVAPASVASAASAPAAPVAAAPQAQPTQALPAVHTPEAAALAQAKPQEPPAAPVGPGAPQPGPNVLLAHGAAPYRHDPDKAESYFVTYRDAQGAEKTAWGVDLERAVADSGVQVGDALTLENLGARQVSVQAPIKDDAGRTIGVEEKTARRNIWEIEKQSRERGRSNKPGDERADSGVADTAVATTVAGLREQVEKALAGQPDNVRRVVMDRLAERLQGGLAVQAEHQKSASPAQDLKPAIDARLAQVDMERLARETVAEVSVAKDAPGRDIAKQGAPKLTH